jgi:regulator of protease activity HflC (stomatin/prohibitin superfamily)
LGNTPTYLTYLFCIYAVLFLLFITFLLASVRIVQEDKLLSVYRLGKHLGEKGPGLVLLIPFVDRGVMKELSDLEDTAGQRLIGAVGETRTTVFTGGKVQIGEEEWEATSQSVISAGKPVRVVKIILEVEEEKTEELSTPEQ